MNLSRLCPALLALLVSAAPAPADAQQPAKAPRVGVLFTGTPAGTSHLLGAFRQGLHDLGYVEGQNITVEPRWAEGDFDRLPHLAAEFVRLKVDVILAGGTPGALAAKQATSTIPVVMGPVGDPVGSGLVASLARPGGNVTGLSLLAPELGAKRLQLLKEVVPGASRVAILSNPRTPYAALVVKETEVAARVLGIQLMALEVRRPEQLQQAFEAVAKGGVKGLTVVEDPLVLSHRATVVALAAKHRLPAIYGFREMPEAGGLMSYAANLADLYRRAAIYVDKILKGAKPADLPVEQPTRFEFVINLKTAKALSLTIPQPILLRADKIIE